MNQTTDSVHKLGLSTILLLRSTHPSSKYTAQLCTTNTSIHYPTSIPSITTSKAIIPTNKPKVHSKTIKNTTSSHSFHSPHRPSSSPSLHSDNTGEAPDCPSLVPPLRSPGRTCVAWAETWVFFAAKRLFRTHHCHIYMKTNMQFDKVV